ncbi:MAG: hypothetical protein IT235_08730, partial [Bacteroidia bacterium]|nr:hypothetical protein [Bacteroidia bacterium]
MINSTKKINAIVSGIIIASLIIVSCKKKDDTVAATTTTNACGVAAPAASYNGPVGIGDTIQFKAAAISGASYKWTGPKSFVSYTQNPTLVFAKGMEGDYSVTATAGGCTSEAYHVYVTNCEITAKADSAVTGGSLNLYASTIMGPTNQPIDATYSWTGPNTYTSSVQNPVISAVTTAAIGTYTVVATTSGGHKSQPATVTVIITPAAPTLSTNSPRTVGTSLTLTAQNIAGAKYTWSGPNGFSLIDTTNNVITINNVSRAAAGTYYVTYKVSGVTSKQGKATVAINYSANGCGSLTEITYNSKTYGVVQIGTTQCWM